MSPEGMPGSLSDKDLGITPQQPQDEPEQEESAEEPKSMSELPYENLLGEQKEIVQKMAEHFGKYRFNYAREVINELADKIKEYNSHKKQDNQINFDHEDLIKKVRGLGGEEYSEETIEGEIGDLPRLDNINFGVIESVLKELLPYAQELNKLHPDPFGGKINFKIPAEIYEGPGIAAYFAKNIIAEMTLKCFSEIAGSRYENLPNDEKLANLNQVKTRIDDLLLSRKASYSNCSTNEDYSLARTVTHNANTWMGGELLPYTDDELRELTEKN